MIHIYLYHYFDKTIGPFVNLSDIPIEEAKAVLEAIKESKPDTQGAKRHPTYVEDRLYYEEILRTEFAKKGGVIRRSVPHYMIVEHSPWLSTWFENGAFIKIPIEEFDIRTVSLRSMGCPRIGTTMADMARNGMSKPTSGAMRR